MDELAHAAGADPVAFRLRHLDDPRAREAIALAADRFGWANPLPPGQGRGFAFARYKNLGAYCAIALSLAVEHETGRTSASAAPSPPWTAARRSTPTASRTRSRAR